MTVEESLERLRKLMMYAPPTIFIKLSDTGDEMIQWCSVCDAQMQTKLELTDDGDARMFEALETFQRDHTHDYKPQEV